MQVYNQAVEMLLQGCSCKCIGIHQEGGISQCTTRSGHDWPSLDCTGWSACKAEQVAGEFISYLGQDLVGELRIHSVKLHMACKHWHSHLQQYARSSHQVEF